MSILRVWLIATSFFKPPAGFPRVPHHGSQLQYILFPGGTPILLTELVRQFFAAIYISGTNEVNRDLDAVTHVAHLVTDHVHQDTLYSLQKTIITHLMRASSGDENCFSWSLHDTIASDPFLFEKLLT